MVMGLMFCILKLVSLVNGGVNEVGLKVWVFAEFLVLWALAEILMACCCYWFLNMKTNTVKMIMLQLFQPPKKLIPLILKCSLYAYIFKLFCYVFFLDLVCPCHREETNHYWFSFMESRDMLMTSIDETVI